MDISLIVGVAALILAFFIGITTVIISPRKKDIEDVKTELKDDIRTFETRVNDKIDKLDARVDNLEVNVNKKIDDLEAKVDNKIDNLGDKFDALHSKFDDLIIQLIPSQKHEDRGISREMIVREEQAAEEVQYEKKDSPRRR